MTPNVNQYAKPMQLTSGVGASAPLPNYQTALQQQAQQNVPNQGQYNGNPQGAYNMGQYNIGYAQIPFSPYMGSQMGYNPNQYNMQYQGGQSPYLGRYTPPTMKPGSAFLQQGLYNSNQWNDQGGYQYNLPNAYGQTGLNYWQLAQMPMSVGIGGYTQPQMDQFQQQRLGQMRGQANDLGGATIPMRRQWAQQAQDDLARRQQAQLADRANYTG